MPNVVRQEVRLQHFCRGLCRVTRCGVALLASLMGTPAAAQQTLPDAAPLTFTLDLNALRDLPSSDNLFSLLETTQAEIVSDHFSAGANAAEPARLGAFLTSWTQTTFRVDDVDINSADRGGPLLVPPVALWQRARVTSGLMPADVTGPGLLISLEPLRPSSAWRASATGAGSAESLVATNTRLAPSIVRPAGWRYASATVSGPFAHGRAGVVAAVSTTRSTQFEHGSSSSTARGVDSYFSNLVFRPRTADEIRTVGWRQTSRYPASHATPYVADEFHRREASTHVQATWQHGRPEAIRWRVFGAISQRDWDGRSDLPEQAFIERLVDGPVASLLPLTAGRERRLSLGWRADRIVVSGPGFTHTVETGVDASHDSSHSDGAPGVSIAERVGGIPARVWTYSASGASHRYRTSLAGFVSDSIALSDDVNVETALRVDRVVGAAQGSRQGVTWNTLLPRAAFRWRLSDRWKAAVHSSYGRTADTLLLDLLAYGDPAAPVADVRRGDGTTVGPLVARTGPGAGAAGTLTGIDSALKRPVTSEVIVGLDATPPGFPRIRVAAISRRRTSQLALFNVGVPASEYEVSYMHDPGANWLEPDDDQLLPVYNRLPASFGRDRYVLSNFDDPAATFRGVTLTLERSTEKMFLSAGAVMGFTAASAGNRGFGPGENDGAVIGELFSDPNATTHAYGELFADRQYNVKIAAVYRFAHEITVGAVARYQDGQPFARMVVVDDLNQGPDAIRAFRNGKSRFTFTGTLDVRIQKGLAIGGAGRAVLVLDAFNVLNMDKEVEEWVVTGSDYRKPTAVQPPRTIHLGLRFSL